MNRKADKVLHHVMELLQGCKNLKCKLALSMIKELRQDDENRKNGKHKE